MAAPPYMKLYVGDYLGDTHHLGALEHGAYLLLLMAMWRAGGTLPANDASLAKLARCTPAEWDRIRDNVIAFFRRSRGKLTHKRLTAEMSKYEDISRKRSEAVQAREAKKTSKSNGPEPSSDGSSDVRLIAKPEPEPELDKRSKDLSVGPDETGPTESGKPKPEAEPWDLDPAFGKLWSMSTPQGRTRAKAKRDVWPFWKAARKRWSAEQLVAGMAAYLAKDPDVQRTGGPGLHIWLRDKAEHWIDAGQPAASVLGLDWAESRWAAALEIWRQDGSWEPRLGPAPDQPGCRAPAGLIQQHQPQEKAA